LEEERIADQRETKGGKLRRGLRDCRKKRITKGEKDKQILDEWKEAKDIMKE
jgi:hypothetical protein